MKQILNKITFFLKRAKVHFFSRFTNWHPLTLFAKKSEAFLFGKSTIFPKSSEIKIFN